MAIQLAYVFCAEWIPYQRAAFTGSAQQQVEVWVVGQLEAGLFVTSQNRSTL